MKKVNLLYRGTNSQAISWHGTLGILHALKRRGLLHYSFNSNSPMRELNFNEFQKYPILIMKGYHYSCHGIIDQMRGVQFMASIESESLLNKDGSPQNMDGYNREYCHKVDMVFAHSTKDCQNYYGRKAVPYHCFMDTNLFHSSHEPISDNLAFIGTTREREPFIEMCNSAVPMHVEETPKQATGEETAKLLVDTMCNYKYLVSGLGKISRYLSGRTYEIMACERVCFQYVDDECLQEFDSSILRDGENIVFFRNAKELKEKFEHYSSKPELCKSIAKNARETALKYNDLDKACHYFVDKMYEEMNQRKLCLQT